MRTRLSSSPTTTVLVLAQGSGSRIVSPPKSSRRNPDRDGRSLIPKELEFLVDGGMPEDQLSIVSSPRLQPHSLGENVTGNSIEGDNNRVLRIATQFHIKFLESTFVHIVESSLAAIPNHMKPILLQDRR